MSTPQSTLSTRSRRKVQETPSSVHTQKSKSPPKKKTKSAKALNKQLDEAEPSTKKVILDISILTIFSILIYISF